MAHMRRKGGKLHRMHTQDPNCYWCGRTTRYGMRGYVRQGLHPHDATVDHLYGRATPERQAGDVSVVLACRDCNQKRAALQKGPHAGILAP